MRSIELLPAGFTHDITPGPEATQESGATQAGGIRALEAIALTTGTGVSSVVAAAATFRVTSSVATDGTDVFTGAFSPGVDALGNGANVDVTSGAIFQEASVDAFPISAVPTTSAWFLGWLAAGLCAAGLALSTRRTRSVECGRRDAI